MYFSYPTVRQTVYFIDAVLQTTLTGGNDKKKINNIYSQSYQNIFVHIFRGIYAYDNLQYWKSW